MVKGNGMQRRLGWMVLTVLFLGTMGLGMGSQTVKAQAAEVVDQSSEAATDAYTNGASENAQTFTAGISGVLTRIEFRVIGYSSSSYPIEIQTVGSNGFPTGTVLATGQLFDSQKGW